MNDRRILIVGGGIVGLATAFRLGQRFPDARLTVLEKEGAVGRHQSSHNSGVLHCGLYYKPGSLKARLAVRGVRQMTAFCREYNIPHEVCGKLVVAASEEELPRLRDLYERGIENGLQGLRLLRAPEMHEIEPHAAGVAALHVPEEGIVDYQAVCAKLSELLAATGHQVVTGARVRALRPIPSGWRALTTRGEFEGEFLINCAGLHSDRVCELAGERRVIRIVPFRGEYYKLRAERQYLVRNLIYPVPDPRFPFLGVHFTRQINGGIEAGPSAVLALAREGYRKSDVNLRDLFDALSYGGLWRFVARYPRMCYEELRRSFSKKLFCRSLQRLVPEVQEDDLATGGAGVRAQALGPQGELEQDFQLKPGRKALHVLNAPSPAATASLAIGGNIVNIIAGEV